MMKGRGEPFQGPVHRVGSDAPFLIGLMLLGGFYVVLILATLLADAWFTTRHDVIAVLGSPEIRYATKLSLFSSVMTTILSLWVAVPIGYLMSRFHFRGKVFFDAVLDIPIVLPPLVIGLSLLILFQTPLGQSVERACEHVTDWLFGRPLGITYSIPGVILAQFMVAAAFAVRTMRTTFDDISPRKEQVALTLGCTRGQAFWQVLLPEARRGVLAAATLTWARSIGEFGPILVFAGATRFKTEVLPTTVFLELSIGRIEAAVAVSLVMVGMALAVLVAVRLLGGADPTSRWVR
jgi:molybdate transport system permease protein